MFANLVKEFRGAACAAAAIAAAVCVACATAQAPSGPDAELAGVRVETGADATKVVLLGVAGTHPTAVEEQNPARIVVEVPASVAPAAEGATPVWDGTLEEVTVVPQQTPEGESRTQVLIGLAADAVWEMQASEDGLVVRVARTQGIEEAAPLASAEMDPWETEAGGAPASPAKRATVLNGVAVKSQGPGVVLDLQADGRIEDAKSFVLEAPLRLVVDLPGLTSQVTDSRVPVEHALVSGIRVGQHEDKVRVVVDGQGEAGSFAEAKAPHAGGMWLALGGAELPATATEPALQMASEAAPAAPDPAPAEAAATGTEPAASETGKASVVHGVQLDSTESHDRVVIVTDAPADYALVSVDEKTLMVQVRGAHIEPEAAVRITPEEPGVVSMVAAFEQPELAQPEVRVVVERVPGVVPTVTQVGTMLMLEFAGTGEKAAPVPVVAAETRGAGEAMDLPAAGEQAVVSASAKAMKQAQSAAPPGPAALDPDGHGIEVLEEGGLLEGKVYTGRRISLDFKDVEIDDVLRLIAEVSDLNIIAGDEVQGQVTIRLVDVPWDQALDVILLTKGLGFVRVGNVLRIAPSEVLKSEEEARLQEKRAKEKLEDLVVKLQPVNYANVKEVSKMVKRLLTARGTVDIDVRTNTVILKDIPNVIEEATALIKAIDTQTPQVMIEAKIVEANLDYLREVGSRWGVGVQPFEDAFDPGSAFKEDVGGDDFTFQPVQDILGNSVAPNNVAVANPITELATGVVNVGAFLLDDRFNLDLELQAAESEGEGKVISSPRVVTLDNRKASIEQGVSIPFQTFENGDAKLEFIDAVLRLDVTPHITQDRSIIMKIEVQRNAPDDSVPTPTGSPAIAKNEAETETLVRDGQTLVIGGIYVVRTAERQSRVPYFHKIPVLGNAFKSNEVRDARQELLVFVTPRVVVNPDMGS